MDFISKYILATDREFPLHSWDPILQAINHPENFTTFSSHSMKVRVTSMTFEKVIES